MQSNAKPPTKAEQRRFEVLIGLGCVACIQSQRCVPQTIEIHHLTDGGRRRGHSFTVPLCAWHHRGIPIGKLTVEEMRQKFGASFYHDARAFRAEFGTDDALLRFTEQLLAMEALK